MQIKTSPKRHADAVESEIRIGFIAKSLVGSIRDHNFSVGYSLPIEDEEVREYLHMLIDKE